MGGIQGGSPYSSFRPPPVSLGPPPAKKTQQKPQTKEKSGANANMTTKSAAMGYSAIPSGDSDGSNENSIDSEQLARGTPHWKSPAVLSIAALAMLAAGAAIGRLTSFSAEPSTTDNTSADGVDALPMPHGVNLASWLALEDYFYVGDNGAVEVATPDGSTVAQCLPPLHTGPSTGPKWNSETDLFANLTDMGTIRSAIKTFHAFRVSYLDFDDELPRIAKLGIQRVRVPVSWCLTDHDPSDDDILGEAADEGNESDVKLEKRYTCIDPFFEADFGDKVTWPAVPRPFLVQFLRACNRHGIKATLDVHTYPGGTSLGTFSGLWPRKPLFWKHDDPERPEKDTGRRIYRELLEWIESLAESDPEAFAGVGAITPMNEPGHLAGLFGPGSANPDVKSFMPSLPAEVAKKYLSDLESDGDSESSFVSVPDGTHLRVLLWQRDAVSAFRSTSLPQRGIELHVNVHESIFVPSLVPNDPDDPGGRHPQATSIVASWWRATTTQFERATWAVLDMHHYHAWEPFCQGTVDGPPLGNYTCGDADATDAALGQCASWAGVYRSATNEQVGNGGARLASGEFSASTHHSVLHSCVDTTTLRKSYLAQVEAANDNGVELYWWSWKMPHGGAFRPAWSLKQFLYMLGVEGFSTPDESDMTCGD